jgi:nucleoside phosphorylase
MSPSWGGVVPKKFVDIAVIVPLLEEFDRLKSLFPVTSEQTSGSLFIAGLDLGHDGLSGVAVLQDDMGKSAATRAADYAIANFDIGVIVVLGIAGGLSDDVSVGEVCISGTIIDVLENAKIADNGKGTKITFDPSYYSTDRLLTFSLKYLKISEETKSTYDEWRLGAYYEALALVPGEFIGRKNKNEVIALPDFHDGSIVCGSVSKSQVYNSSLKDIDRKLLAIETESAGPFHSAGEIHIPVVTIRGVCDYADKNKSRLEDETGGHLRRVAAFNAVSFLKAQLKNPQFMKYVRDRKATVLGESTELFDITPESTVIADAKASIAGQIDAQLRALSPEYQSKPKGYRLPMPRIKPSEANVGVSSKIRQADEAIGVLEAVVAARAIAIEVPRTFPDNSLPWIIASELSLIQIEGKAVIPVVIKGDDIGPPTNGLERQMNSETAQAIQCPSATTVFILDNMPLGSKPRADYLVSEIEKYPNSKIIFVNKDEGNFARKSELLLQIGADQFTLTDVSFAEMSDFIQRNFNLPDQKAGVIALRLRDTFERFDLTAHPSYFAGVAGETLMSLLHANRRAELIQLAVDGFLSFVVASDTNTIVLSRTSRAKFLRQLVFEMRVMKRTFSRSDLITFTEQHAKENDFDIDPFVFIRSFVEKGIVHFVDNILEITLPFIESYLLALELIQNPIEAKRYFDPHATDFDFLTFDLYCELGPAKTIISDVTAELSKATAEISRQLPGKHILLTDEVRPPIVDKRQRLKALEGRLQKAFEDVALNRPNSQEKQQLIDVATHLEDRARDATEEVARSTNDEAGKSFDQLGQCFQQWVIGTIALGSASEHLSADDKRSLAQVIVTSTSVLMDAWMRAFPKGAFDQFKAGLVSDDALRKAFDLKDGIAIDPSLKEFAEAIVDAYEFSLLSQPMRVMFQQIGDAAGQKVLATSISKVAPSGLMEDLIAATWAAEVDAGKTKTRLLGAIRALPPTPFLRFALSQHYMTRVFWNHWELPSRMALLEAAEVALEPLGGGKIDRMKIKRLVAPEEPAE